MSPIVPMNLEELAKSQSPRGYFPGEAEPDSLYRQAEVRRLMKQLQSEPAPANEQAPRGLLNRLRFAFGR
ncbi:MAG: hypothetical protein U0547_02150 [Dehalococcoidia bacterium]